MAITLTGRTGTTTDPYRTMAPIVYTRENFAAGTDWLLRPELVALDCRATTAGRGIGELTIERRYGDSVKHHTAAAAAEVTPIDLANHWVRLAFVGPQGDETVWMGRISSEVREPWAGAGGPPVKPRGIQRWTAYDPLQLLGKLEVWRSWWLDGATELDLGWLPGFNDRQPDTPGLLVGNRSATTSDAGGTLDATYLFGGTALWSRLQALEYVLARYVRDETNGGPRWELSGQVDALAAMTDTVRLGTRETVANLVRRLIDPALGLDFVIRPLPESAAPGFDLHVFALAPAGQVFGDATMPQNASQVTLDVATFGGGTNPPTVRVVETLDRQYDQIDVVGARVVVVCTLRGRKNDTPKPGNSQLAVPQLVGKWTAALEAEYKAGSPATGATSEQHAEARKVDRFRPVYQHLGAPADWDFSAGFWTTDSSGGVETVQPGGATPPINYDGLVLWGPSWPVGGPDGLPDQTGANQRQVRSTLPWLPLYEGYDYQPLYPVNLNPDNHQPELLPPFVLLWDREKNRWVLAEQAGMTVRAATQDWGVELKASPNHTLALNHWSGAADSEAEPVYDYEEAMATIAFRLDQRLGLRYRLTSGNPRVVDTKVIEVPDAELWYQAPDTIIDLTPEGSLVVYPVGRVLRNDQNRLAAVMAGAVARYHMQRARAEITVPGLWPWTTMLGQVLAVIESGGQRQLIGAAITSMEWRLGDRPTTTLRTGFA